MNEQIAQLENVLKNAESILILSHKNIDGDWLSSMIVLQKLLEKKGKKITALVYETIADKYAFLPGINDIDTNTVWTSDFIISLKRQGIEIDKLKYTVDGDYLNIVISPKNWELTADNIETRQGVGSYDLIFVLDSGDLDHIGRFYEENTELFFDVPVINIDHHSSNTGFGQVNLVDITAASTTQIIYNLIQEIEWDEFIDKDIATLLLTGIIVDTWSFQHTNTSPKALEIAANLIEKGAEQQEIINNIYKTKKLGTLKLWGRVLSKIKEDNIYKIVWSTITKQDLDEVGSSVEDADWIIDELMVNAPGIDIVILLKESESGEFSVSLRSTNIAVDTLPIAQHFGGGGHKQASGFKQKWHDFNQFVSDVIKYIEKYQKTQLNLSDEEIALFQNEKQDLLIKNEDLLNKSEKDLVKNKSIKSGRDIVSEISDKNESVIDNPKKGEVIIKKVISTSKNDKFKSKNQNPNQNTQQQASQNFNNQKSKKPFIKKVNKYQWTIDNKKGESGKVNIRKTEQQEVRTQPQVKQAPVQAKPQVKQAPVQTQPQVKQAPVQAKPEVKQNPVQTKPEVKQSPVQAQPEVKQNPVQTQPEVKKEIVNSVKTEKQEVKAESKVQVEQKTEQSANQTQAQPEITKEQAIQYANYYSQQLHSMDQSTPEYAKIYWYYEYYYKMGNS